jgi:hypothetical protein
MEYAGAEYRWTGFRVLPLAAGFARLGWQNVLAGIGVGNLGVEYGLIGTNSGKIHLETDGNPGSDHQWSIDHEPLDHINWTTAFAVPGCFSLFP